MMGDLITMLPDYAPPSIVAPMIEDGPLGSVFEPSFFQTNSSSYVRKISKTNAIPNEARRPQITSAVEHHERSPSWPLQAALGRLRKFKTWHENWNAEGAPAPDHQLIEAASNLLGLVGRYQSPKVMLSSDAVPMLLFSDAHFDGEITISAKNEIEFYFSAPMEVGDTVPFDGMSIPPALLGILQNKAG